MDSETLSASFPAEKMEALRFYMAEKGLSVEGELQSYLGQLYEKNVPTPTRRYLDRHDEPAQAAHQEEKSDEPQPEPASAKRLSKRQTEKQHKSAIQPLRQQEPEPVGQEQAEPEGPVMTMSM